MKILLCKNNAVYNIDTETVLNQNLLPGLMRKNPCKETFKLWLKLRYSSNTNSLARKLKGITFGQGNRITIDKVTHILSLSDCYWVKDDDDPVQFEDVSPYYNGFWTGKGFYDVSKGGAIPTLYVSGYLSKEWVSSKYLYKYDNSEVDLSIEVEVSRLCRLCNIPVCYVQSIEKGVCLTNFTSPDLMLEQADQSGKIDPDDFDEYTIINMFGTFGIQMITVDAIIGNGDRHAGNFGWLRDTNTGFYVSPAPLYDFDHALDSKLSMDILIERAAAVIKQNAGTDEAERICHIFIESATNTIFRNRAISFIGLLLK